MEFKMVESEISEEEKDLSPSDADWENRILCSDGNCIGVVGPDGRCKECGKKYEGPLPQRPAVESPAEEEEPPPEEKANEDVAGPDDAGELPADDDWANRKLCTDGGCIGVIGPDGRCKECGKPYE
jgi:hypothetical protein